MKQAVKGALLSGTVFPGLGQIVLKHYARGIALMITVTAGVAALVKIALEQALAILEQIQWDGGTIDMSAISRAAARASTHSDSSTFKLLLLLIVCCWVIGTVDAYRIGRRKDRAAESAAPAAAQSAGYGRPPGAG